MDKFLERDIQLMFELGTLRHISRTWKQFGGIPYSNVAEHTLRVAWIGLVISNYERADGGRVLKLALIHDIPETRTGDVNYLTRMYVTRHEDHALADMISGVSMESELAELWEEMRAKTTLESKIVKDADTLDCDLELVESASTGSSLLSTLRGTRDRAFEKLHTDTAKRMFNSIYASDPQKWHLQGRNRMTAGDWGRPS